MKWEIWEDRLEQSFTRRRYRPQNPPPRWLRWMLVNWTLSETQCYNRRLIWREIGLPTLFAMLPMLLIWPLTFLMLGIHRPWFYRFLKQALLHRGSAHRLLVGLLAKEGFYSTPWEIGSLLIFSMVLFAPRVYFWNRRAKRLRTEAATQPSLADAPPSDLTFWPPPPTTASSPTPTAGVSHIKE